METNPSPNVGGLQLLLLLAFLVPAILFLLTQQHTLKLIRQENRRMFPGLVWLQLIPVLGQIWQFFVVFSISGSIERELQSPRGDSILGVEDVLLTNVTTRKQPTLGIGLTFSSFYWLSFLATVYMAATQRDGEYSQLLVVGFFAWATIVCWIIYWVRLAWYKRKLKALLVLA